MSTLAGIVNGKLIGEDQNFSRLCTDTRNLEKGDLFVALKGKNFDGHHFVIDAIDLGAVGALVNHGFQNNTDFKSSVHHLKSLVMVDDTLKAYGLLASHHANSIPLKKAAITGSCGKTSVKELVQAILQTQGQVLATKGNLNNEIGVPKTLLEINDEHDFAVIELGANHVGEIKYLSALVKADVVAITNADRAHLEGFGSVDGVAQAKGEIFSGAAPDATAVLSLDDKYFDFWKGMVAQANLKLLCTSLDNPLADIYLVSERAKEFGFDLKISITGEIVKCSLPLAGRHNIKNALTAIGITYALGASKDSIVKGLANVKPAKGRLNKIKINDKLLLIDDTYNANPLSVRAAIDVLASFTANKTLIMGDMAELGKQQKDFHEEIGVYAKTKGINCLLSCGKFSVLVFNSFNGKGNSFEDKDSLIANLKKHIDFNRDNVLLVKGSRSSAMEKVVDAIVRQEYL